MDFKTGLEDASAILDGLELIALKKFVEITARGMVYARATLLNFNLGASVTLHGLGWTAQFSSMIQHLDQGQGAFVVDMALAYFRALSIYRVFVIQSGWEEIAPFLLLKNAQKIALNTEVVSMGPVYAT